MKKYSINTGKYESKDKKAGDFALIPKTKEFEVSELASSLISYYQDKMDPSNKDGIPSKMKICEDLGCLESDFDKAWMELSSHGLTTFNGGGVPVVFAQDIKPI